MPELNTKTPELGGGFIPSQETKEALEIPKPIEHPVTQVEKTPLGAAPAITPAAATSPVSINPSLELQHRIESVLAEDLDQVYKELTLDQQAKFKILGEATSKRIVILLQQTKIKFNEIMKLIRQWLVTLPGINKYFLEQEAKIKADKIIKFRSGG